jgi:hypothetical protein
MMTPEQEQEYLRGEREDEKRAAHQNAVDTSNRQLVGVRGDLITVMFPQQTMSKSSALVHAAYLVLLADPGGEEFARVLKAVRSV